MRFAAQYNGGPAFEPGGYLTDWYGDHAVRAIEANKDRPFFLYLAHWAPHTPLQALREDYEALSHMPAGDFSDFPVPGTLKRILSRSNKDLASAPSSKR